MQISFQGLSSFHIVTKNAQNEVRVVTDPYDSTTGLRYTTTLEAELVLVTQDAPVANNTGVIGGHPFLVTTSGEYEVAGVFVYGFSVPLKTGTAHTIYLIEVEGMRLLHLGALDRRLTEEEMKQIGAVDVLFVPVGGGSVLTPSVAAELVQALEPRAVVPMYFGKTKLDLKEETSQAFVKEIGAPVVDEGSKWKFKKVNLPEEEMVVVLLS